MLWGECSGELNLPWDSQAAASSTGLFPHSPPHPGAVQQAARSIPKAPQRKPKAQEREQDGTSWTAHCQDTPLALGSAPHAAWIAAGCPSSSLSLQASLPQHLLPPSLPSSSPSLWSTCLAGRGNTSPKAPLGPPYQDKVEGAQYIHEELTPLICEEGILQALVYLRVHLL